MPKRYHIVVERPKMSMTPRHEQALYKLAKWIKAHRQLYAPITAVTDLPDYRRLLKDLKKWGYITPYKSGQVQIVTKRGWLYIIEKYPELARRS